ncbi:hypothetical protein ACGH52_01890 [Streptomyces sp. BBFR25]|uniref:hypothetical protein n=1 Tax=Streptomyces sp. BBFR25 TaxID=3372855 RepID=UPI0037DCBA66
MASTATAWTNWLADSCVAALETGRASWFRLLNASGPARATMSPRPPPSRFLAL